MADGTVFWTAVAAIAAVGLTWLGYLGYRLQKRMARERPNAAPPPGTLPHPILPDPTRNVVGRREELRRLRKILRPGPVARLLGQVAVRGAVVHGHGGFGKSTLARHYVQKYGRGYARTIWIEAEDPTRMLDQLHVLCGYFGEATPEQRSAESAQQLLTRLADTGKRFLLVYDNVESFAAIKDLLPRQGSRIDLIVTTRQGTGWQGFGTLELATLDFETEDGPAVALLVQEAERGEDRAGARALAEALGGLPLALVVAGAIAKRSQESWGEIATQIDRVIATAPKNEAYSDSVIGAVALSYERLSADAKLVAEIFAWWAPEGLCAELLTEAPAGELWTTIKYEVPEDVRDLAQAPTRVAMALEELEDRSLLRREGTGFSLHRMSAAALRALQAEAPRNAEAGALLASVYPTDPRISGAWPTCRRLIPHVRALWVNGMALGGAPAVFLLEKAMLFFAEIGDAAAAEALARASLEMKRARLPDSEQNVAVAYLTLGGLLQVVGDLDGAERELRQAVDLNKRHRPESLGLADSLDTLGLLLLEKGDPRTALKELQQAGALVRRLVPRESGRYAQALINLGGARDSLEQGTAALRFYRAALAIDRKVLPEGDVRLGYALNNIGSRTLLAGAADEAEALLREGLNLRRAVYLEAPKHPEILGTAKWLVAALLVLAHAGEETARREAEARALCDEFGFDFEQMKRAAARYPYTPGAGHAG